MEASYTAVVQQRETWWIGWIEEVPGVNSQGETREELLENLRSALEEALEMNRADALAAAQGAPYEEVRLSSRTCPCLSQYNYLLPMGGVLLLLCIANSIKRHISGPAPGTRAIGCSARVEFTVKQHRDLAPRRFAVRGEPALPQRRACLISRARLEAAHTCKRSCSFAWPVFLRRQAATARPVLALRGPRLAAHV